jgi:hypothetical protein
MIIAKACARWARTFLHFQNTLGTFKLSSFRAFFLKGGNDAILFTNTVLALSSSTPFGSFTMAPPKAMDRAGKKDSW